MRQHPVNQKMKIMTEGLGNQHYEERLPDGRRLSLSFL